MSVLGCDRVRRLLPCYHDGELDMDTQVAVQTHLRGCAGCRAERRALREVGLTVRAAMLARVPEDRGGVERHVLGRLQAERAASWRRRVAGLFEDMHLVWAAAGATAATVVIGCALVAALALALREQPFSMAALIGALASPGSDRNPVSVDGRMLLPRSDPDAIMGTMPLDVDDNSLYALAAVVTREGRVRNLELLRPDSQGLSVEDGEVLELLEAVSQARFEPARAGGMPVAVNLVWLVAHTTVRGNGDELVVPVVRQPPARHLAPPVAPPAPPVSELPLPRADIAAA